MSTIDIDQLAAIAEIEFADIVLSTFPLDLNNLRIVLVDGSFIDLWFSLKLANRYSYHWERKALDGMIFRHDNAPHQRWLHVKTYPHHFHAGSEEVVEASYLSAVPATALREFLGFARSWLQNN